MDPLVIWVLSSDPDIRRLIAMNLKKRGLHILETSPEEGMTLPGPKPQLIILDLNTLEEPERRIASRLCEKHRADATPIILLLSKAPTNRFLSSLQPAGWLEKPLDMNALLLSIRANLANDHLPPGQ